MRSRIRIPPVGPHCGLLIPHPHHASCESYVFSSFVDGGCRPLHLPSLLRCRGATNRVRRRDTSARGREWCLAAAFFTDADGSDTCDAVDEDGLPRRSGRRYIPRPPSQSPRLRPRGTGQAGTAQQRPRTSQFLETGRHPPTVCIFEDGLRRSHTSSSFSSSLRSQITIGSQKLPLLPESTGDR